MPAQSTILISSNHANGAFVSDKAKGDGYYNVGDGLHTVQFLFDNFKGSVFIQATLAVDPVESDWFDVKGFEDLAYFDSTAHIGSKYVNFYGNFVWIRAKGTLVEGTIREIRYNH
jgi:hypothetical protein